MGHDGMGFGDGNIHPGCLRIFSPFFYTTYSGRHFDLVEGSGQHRIIRLAIVHGYKRYTLQQESDGLVLGVHPGLRIIISPPGIISTIQVLTREI